MSQIGQTLSSIIGATVQAWDNLLDAISDLSATGLIARTGDGTSSVRTLTGTAGETSITNGDGVSGNPTVGLAANLQLSGTEGINLLGGTTAERPASPIAADFRYNTTLNKLEFYNGSAWETVTSA